ncbi:MAG TPA: hypothetical protein VKE96_28730 [Vicinamibacterales bacterium]|nr:hypothetical protein [Vicinamibacterales bacterium]
MKLRHGPGRPMKYGRAARAVTLTLPEDVIERLSALDDDLGRAIVALAERHVTAAAPVRRGRQPQVSAFGNHAVIVVTPMKELRRLPGVQLVPIGNGRALISLAPGYSVPQLELDLRDATERSDTAASERRTLTALAEILGQSRRSRRVTLEERTIIVLESKRTRRKSRAVAAD